jgi:hypothetical protein
MTEAEWATGTHSYPLLQYLRGKVSHRKLRLFGCSCCRRLKDIPKLPASYLKIIDKTQAFADGQLSDQAFVSVFPAGYRRPPRAALTAASVARMAILALNWPDSERPRWDINEEEETVELVRGHWAPGEYAEHYTSRICLHAAHAETLALLGPGFTRRSDPERFRSVMETADVTHATLFRDIAGNPFRSVAFSPSWRTSSALGLALSMYDARDFAAMPILADALEEAGCDQPDILAHCRGPGPHVCGCWVVDLVLGKA